ncbi:HDOD domain-containing protein [Sulfurivirga sp.]|uniref:HDOD domain-containing protein n=1 Tax=Sulfurivirga sp. TaxID=2614236 RepID=UPI0025D31548|nr:HDOD domain-containing protein [Sulfurivirga sp.]
MKDFLHEAVSLLRSIHVPSLPEEIIRLKEELNKKYPNTVTIARLISKNPEILNHFLKLVNANLTDTDEYIRDAQAAVNILGMQEIYNIFTASAFSRFIAKTTAERDILKHGAKTGVVAAELASFTGTVTRSEAYLAALAQNMGAIFLLRLERDGYEETFFQQMAWPFKAYLEEAKIMQTTHAYAGVIVARKWDMPADIYQAILLHHDEQFIGKTANHPKVRILVALIMMSNYLVSASLGENYMTSEIKRMRQLAQTVLELPNTATRSATNMLLKYCDK